MEMSGLEVNELMSGDGWMCLWLEIDGSFWWIYVLDRWLGYIDDGRVDGWMAGGSCW